MDTLRLSEGLDEAETRRYVSELITVQLGGDFQLPPEQILLVSAHEALLSRLVLRETSGGRPASARSLGMFKVTCGLQLLTSCATRRLCQAFVLSICLSIESSFSKRQGPRLMRLSCTCRSAHLAALALSRSASSLPPSWQRLPRICVMRAACRWNVYQ